LDFRGKRVGLRNAEFSKKGEKKVPGLKKRSQL